MTALVRRETLLKLALAAGSTLSVILLLAVAGEVVARNRERHRTTVPGSMPLLYYRHLRLRPAYVRGGDYFGWIHVNPQGFRGATPTAIDAGGKFRIMAVGASTTADGFVTRDDQAWPAQLQAELGGRAGTVPIEVINAGVPGYYLLDNLIRLQTELYRYRPNLVLLLHGHNELFSALRFGVPTAAEGPLDPTPDESRPIAPWTYWLDRHSLLYGKLRSRWLAVSGARSARRAGAAATRGAVDWKVVLDSGIAQFTRDLDAFLAVASSHGIPVVLLEAIHVSPPAAVDEPDSLIAFRWRATVPSAPIAVVLEGYRRYNAAMADAAARHRLPLVRTTTFGLAGAAFYSTGDPIHFNDAGALRMAQQTGEALLAARLVPAAASRVPAPR